MQDDLREAYEAVPYESNPIAVTYIDSLETMAMLHGMHPAPADSCRVLELGCASGGNLIGMAYQFPDSRFVGIDLAPNHIEDGARRIRTLGLTNIELQTKSIADIDREFGQFDYIICHGVFSWVPDAVQDAVLRVCSDNLTPSGVAYVSYNTYPGWHVREMMRDMLLFHDDRSLPARERIARARAFADHLAASGSEPHTLHSMQLIDEANAVRKQSDAHFLHEQLEPFNQPVYFSEFMRRASSAGLAYIAEARMTPSLQHAAEWVTTAMGGDSSDGIRAEQYTDFARGRMFRATLLCHDAITPSASPLVEVIPALYFSTRGTRAEQRDDASVESFMARDGTPITTNNPVVIATLRVVLRASPATVSFAEVIECVERRLAAQEVPGLLGGASGDALASMVASVLLQCAIAGFVNLHRRPSVFVTRVSERPRASAVTRERARFATVVPNLEHGALEVGDMQRLLVLLLDGTHTRAQLVDVLERSIADGSLNVGDESHDRADLSAAVDTILQQFAASAVLEA